MPLQSQRFAGDPTLERCLNGYRMTAGDTNNDSIKKVQGALNGLGYLSGAQFGVFDTTTGEAVIAYKTDEGLAPNDAVVSVKTMERLDAYFAGEPADPDAPDPTTTGLIALVEAAMATAVGWLTVAIDKLNTWPSDEQHPEDPAWIVLEEALERNFQLSSASPGRANAIDSQILPLLHAAKRAVDMPSPFLVLATMDQASFRSTFPNYIYSPFRYSPGAEILVTPPFRNTLDSEAQAACTIFAGINAGYAGYDQAARLGFPGTRRYARLTGDQALTNNVAYAAFAYEMATGVGSSLRAKPVWSLAN